MPNDLAPLKKIGIECESIEDDSWGVGRLVYKLLEQLATRPELADRYRFHLYFKKRVPDYPFLKAPMFVTTVTTPPSLPASFNLHYHVWMIARAYWDGVDVLFFPNYMLPLLWFKKSLVMLTEDIWYEMRNPLAGFQYRLAYSIFANWAARAATRVMAISHASAAGLHRLFHIPTARIAVNELAVDAPRAAEPMSGRYLLYVGQAFERRHLRETIKAFARIAPSDPTLHLIAIGPDKYDPPIIHDLVTRVNAQLGRAAIRYLERVSDGELARYYRSALACVYVSDMEAFGLPPLEALSYGAPAIVADKPVNREIYGEHAFYVANPKSVDDIERVIRRALKDDAAREQILSAAPEIISRYTWSAHTDRWLTITNETLHA